MNEIEATVVKAHSYVEEGKPIPSIVLNALVNYGCAELQDRNYRDYEERD